MPPINISAFAQPEAGNNSASVIRVAAELIIMAECFVAIVRLQLYCYISQILSVFICDLNY